MDTKPRLKAVQTAEAWKHFFKREPKQGGIFNDINILSEAVLQLNEERQPATCGEKHLSYVLGGLFSGFFIGLLFCLFLG